MFSTPLLQQDYFKAVVTFICLLLMADAKTFEKLDYSMYPARVCSLLNSNFNITLIAMKGIQELDTIVLTSDMSGIKVIGDCEFYMGLVWPNGVIWRITEYSPVYEFTVSFIPYKVFSHVTRSSHLKIYDNPKKARLSTKYSSYKCTKEEILNYVGGSSEEITYKVQVAVTDIQVQITNVWYDQFSSTVCECGVKPWFPIIIIGESSFPSTYWQLFLLILAAVTFMVIGAVATFLTLLKLVRVKRKRRLLRKLCGFRRGKKNDCWQWTNMR
ncbi:hypothetical protein RRG08_015403 [Elysia crispata]|uniref:Uncharacterized protein n=1 Tax=Elysia crispata TaxID=231223 RepID=A0AAE1AUL7_9GAST|nr:hypothetical protein RRG08_015403 [Elysia crispata]